MSDKLDPKLALSAVETESLRALRARLGKPAASEAAKAVLGKVWLETIARVGLIIAEPPAGETPIGVADLAAAADAADMGELRLIVGRLAALRAKGGPGWAKALEARAPQAVISRRLALAGREPAKAES